MAIVVSPSFLTIKAGEDGMVENQKIMGLLGLDLAMKRVDERLISFLLKGRDGLSLLKGELMVVIGFGLHKLNFMASEGSQPR